MFPRFQNALKALAETMVQSKAPLTDDPAKRATAVASFLISVHSRMPDYLRLPFHILVLIFDTSALPYHGRPFHEIGEDARERHVRRWRESRIEICRRFVEFYGTLGTFGLYSDLYGADYAGHTTRSTSTGSENAIG